jgi:hypothetical protein
MITSGKASSNMSWTCTADHKCEERPPVVDERAYATESDCQRHCKSKTSGVVWVYITVGSLIVLSLLLFFVLKSKGDAGMKGLAADSILRDMGAVVAVGGKHVSDALNS